MVGFNLMKNIAGMQLLLLLLLFAQRGSTSTEIPKCHELKGNVKLTDKPDICTKVNGILGSNADSATFNFSQADELTLNNFLAKFTDIYGAIIMDGNDKVETLNFGNITVFHGDKVLDDGIFILIRNNPKLTRIVWNSSVKIVPGGASNIHVLAYNNPMLDKMSQDQFRAAATGKDEIASFVQDTGANECQFESPYPTVVGYTPPTAELLKNCAKIKGDFIVEDVNLTGHAPLQLSDGSCLKLINVDMKNFEFWFAVGSGIAECKDGTRSNITGNPNLCGTEMYKLKQYFKDEFQVHFKADKTTCTKSCPPGVVSNDYLFCVSTPTNPATTDPNVPGAAGSGIATPAAPADPVNTTSSPSSGMEMWKIVAIAAVASCLVIGGIAAIFVLWKKGYLPCCRRGQEGQKKNKDVEKNKKDVEKSGTKTPTSSTDTSRSNEKMVSKVADPKKEEQLKQESEKENEGPKVSEVKKQMKNEPEKEKEESKVSEVKKDKQAKKEPEKEKEEPKNKLKNLPPYPLPANFGSYKFNTTAAVQFVKNNTMKSFDEIKMEFNLSYCGLPLVGKDDWTDDDTKHTQKLLDARVCRYNDQVVIKKTGVQLNDGRDVAANFVLVTVKKIKVKFITTQAPLKNTIVDFWQMVFEKKTGNIVQLNNNTEDGKEKGYPYVPQKKDEEMPFNGVTVVCKETYVAFEVIQVSVLKVTIGEETREIKHYHYIAWPDRGVPITDDHQKALLDLIELVNLETTDEMGPTVVHCSAGIGRTGVYVILDLAIKLLQVEETPDLKQLLSLVRSCRGKAVQQVGQYIFACDILMERILADTTTHIPSRAVGKELVQKMRKDMEKMHSSTASNRGKNGKNSGGGRKKKSGGRKNVEGKKKGDDGKKKGDADNAKKKDNADDAKKKDNADNAKKKSPAAATK